MKILHLDDDRFILELARGWLEQAGHAVRSCDSGEEALRAIREASFDLAVLDRLVPDVAGDEVLRFIRARHPRMPVIVATATEGEEEIGRILDLGADDYLVKPLRRVEFLARVGAVTRRAGTAGAARLEEGAYAFDLRERGVVLAGRPVRLTPRLFELAHLLFARRGELVTRSQIFVQVWGHPEPAASRTLDTHVSRLRRELELDGRHGWRLASVYQQGYRLEPSGDDVKPRP